MGRRMLCAAVVALGGWVSGCGGGDAGNSAFGPDVEPQPAGTVPVIYTVDGSTDLALLTYFNADGGIAQEKAPLPWTRRYFMRDGDFISISAQNERDAGSVRVTITVNGRVARTTTSTGPFVIASASTTCC